jgi:hypothetical protein
MGSSHCQAGQGGRIYKLNKIRNIVSKTTNKRKRNEETLVGGMNKKKTKRRRNERKVKINNKTCKF